MEPTEENRRAWNELHRLRVTASAEHPAIPAPVRDVLPDLAGKHVLHLLCGTGEASAELAALGALVTGVDVWPEALAAARERFAGVVFVHADPHELPVHLRRPRTDLVYVGMGALAYLHDLAAVAAGAAAALRPGGALLVWDTHPALLCLDLPSLRWREDYFGGVLHVDGPLRERTVRLWRLGEIVEAALGAGLLLRRLEELPAPPGSPRHDRRVPSELVLVAEKPRPEAPPRS